MSGNKHHALAREAILAALTAYTGITTADGATPANNTLICADLKGKNDFISEKTILIGSGDTALEDSGASSFDSLTGTITVVSAFSAQIKAGVLFSVLNISTVEIDVATINTKIGTNTDPPGTTTLFAWMANLLAVTGIAEPSATGTTTGAAYIDALDIDARLYNEFTIKLKNTDGANSLDYRVLLRPEHGVAEQMIQPEDITLAPADYDFVNIDHKWGQVIVQVRDTVAPNHADFSVYAICNKQ